MVGVLGFHHQIRSTDEGVRYIFTVVIVTRRRYDACSFPWVCEGKPKTRDIITVDGRDAGRRGCKEFIVRNDAFGRAEQNRVRQGWNVTVFSLSALFRM